MNKITLGTAQWGMNYGITNSDGIPNNEELKTIINLAKKSQITFLDTASGYGNAEQRIGNLTNNEFNIITKVGNINLENSIKHQLTKSLKNVKTESVYGCLFHNVDELLKNPSLWEEIQAQKKEGLVKKVGYSLYHPQELERLLRLNYIPELIQIPFNLLDRRFEPYLRQLKGMKIEIHVRSIFLQGLLLSFEKMNQNKFLKWKPIWEGYHDWLKTINLSPLEACISHVLHYKEISNIIIGVEHASQLKQIILASRKKSIEAPKMLISTDQELINPSSWL